MILHPVTRIAIAGRVLSRLAVFFLFVAVAPQFSLAQSLEAKIEALAKTLVDADPVYQSEDFKRISESTRDMVKVIDIKQVEIGLHRMSIEELKHEPALTVEQLRWLVEIEDVLVEAEGKFRGARGNYIIADIGLFADDQNTEVNKKLKFHALMDASRLLTEASRRYDKAKRDLGTLRTRIEIQK